MCEDFDECTNSCYNNCNQTVEICINLQGTYKCECKNGFTKSELNENCSDIDECKVPTLCHYKGYCLNSPGSYSCFCKTGFYGNGTYCEGNFIFILINIF